MSHQFNDSDDSDSEMPATRPPGHGHQPSLVPVGIVSVTGDVVTEGAPAASNGRQSNGAAAVEEQLNSLNIDGQNNSTAPAAPTAQPTQPQADQKKTQKAPPAAISYAAERVIGNGSFGVVYQATVIETGETVAIKKVLQDRRFKNRELEIMGMLGHPNVVQLRHCFYSKGDKPEEVYLNLVMEYIPETLHRTLRTHTKAQKLIPTSYVKVYMYQLLRSVAYLHSVRVSHRDIKPQNVLMNPRTHEVKLCDFGSAKILVAGEPNVSYICSRYYRAPELVFEATEYTPAIDCWSVGCVMGELLLGTPLFPGESGVDQLIEIIKVLGTPTREEIYAMNPHHTSFKFPQIKAHPWAKIFPKAPPAAVDLISKLLIYDPKKRIHPLESLAHPFFDELREQGAKLPNGKPLPALFNFTENEVKLMKEMGILKKLMPYELTTAVPSSSPSPSSSAVPSAPSSTSPTAATKAPATQAATGSPKK